MIEMAAPANPSKTSILIIEDDPALSKMYQEKFTHEGFDAFVANDGQAGLNMALTKKPSCILLDMMLPKYSGMDVLSQLRQDKNGADTTVICLSNKTEREHMERALKFGVKEYLAKAMYTPEEVVERVKKYLK